MRKNIKWIIAITAVAIASGTISAFAASYLASDIKYRKNDGTDVKVSEALDELYERKDTIYEKGALKSTDGVIEIEIQHDNPKAHLVAQQIDLSYSINNQDNFKTLNAVPGATNLDNRSLYEGELSVHKGDILYLKNDTMGSYGYVLVY